MVNIKALEAEDLHEFLDFFDHRAFANDPDWDGCYCQSFLNDQPAWDGESDPKPILRQSSCDKISQGKMQGYLAYEDDRVVGWCAAGESKLFNLPEADEKLARVVCFVIEEGFRGRGIADQLLGFALKDLTAKGFAEVEAKPVRPEDKSKMNFRGPYSMYLKHGFADYRDLGEDGILVRKEL
jgi:ribosomal protein S18 acetylase RimI-like enzyme